MPLLEIANARLSFQNPMCSLAAQKLFQGKLASNSFAFGNEQRIPCAWKSQDKFNNVDFHVGCIVLQRGKLLIKAVATFEPKHMTANEDKCIGLKELGLNLNQPGLQHDSCNEESIEFDDREKLRRMRISKRNKGHIPWNKGKKHSAETLLKIRERTRLAMQDPKVKMKLVNLGHAQTKETRQKIGAGVKLGWERRRVRLKVQEMCYFQWQNLIAEAAKLGCVGEEELEWNSYETLDKGLNLEWMETVKQRRKVPRVRDSKRKPKSPEHRRKIAEAISAKWADPDYRGRVCSALAKYHGIKPGAESRQRRRPSDSTQTARRSPTPTKKKASDTNISVNSGIGLLTHQMRLKSKSPAYKDPFVSSKLEMIKNIRAQRTAAETKQAEAIDQARLLIVEAEKAAKALEVAAMKSPIAQASLIEARKLIAEATQTLESIETQAKTESDVSSVALTEVEEETGAAFEVKNLSTVSRLNGRKTLSSSNCQFFNGFGLQKSLNGDQEHQLTTSNSYLSFSFGLNSQTKESGSADQPGPGETKQDLGGDYKNDPAPALVEIQPLKDNTPSDSVSDTSPTLTAQPSLKGEMPSRSVSVTKKWVRGRLVEVVEETR